MKEQVLAVLKRCLPQIDFESSQTLVDDGVLDSLSIVTMVSELSMEFGIIFDLDELTPENLNSLDNITATIEKMLQDKK
ncbi:MAG: acyl carrier protein [Synergistaceae bacterium]|nr:acyl carrier protein [Synergistaceae bacterium]